MVKPVTGFQAKQQTSQYNIYATHTHINRTNPTTTTTRNCATDDMSCSRAKTHIHQINKANKRTPPNTFNSEIVKPVTCCSPNNNQTTTHQISTTNDRHKTTDTQPQQHTTQTKQRHG